MTTNLQGSALVACSETDEGAVGFDPRRLESMSRDQMIELVCSLQRQVMVRRTDDGVRQGIMQLVPLRLGHEILQLARSDGEPIGAPFVTAAGYYRLASIMGWSVKTPERLMVDGDWRGNPYFRRNEDTRAIEAVYVRKIVVGRTAHGNLVARDQTVVFNPWAYLIEDLHGKERWNTEDIYGDARRVEDDGRLAPPPEPGWAFFPELDLPGGQAVGMMVRAGNGDVRRVLKSYASRLKKVVEIATTFCERNAFKKALGVPESPPVYDGMAYIPVVAWQHADREWAAINEAIASIEDGVGGGVSLETETTEMDARDTTVSIAETASAGDAAASGGDAATTAAAEEEAVQALAEVVEAHAEDAPAQATTEPGPVRTGRPEPGDTITQAAESDPGEGQAPGPVDARLTESAAQGDAPTAAPDGAPAGSDASDVDVHGRGLTFSDGPKAWLRWMYERGLAYRRQLGDGAFARICAQHGTDSDHFHTRGRQVLESVIADAERAAAEQGETT